MAVLITDVQFDQMLRTALEAHVEAETEKAITAAKEKLDQALRKGLAALVMTLVKSYTVTFDQREIVITVKNEAKL
ncbi:hypothetical protein [Sphingopyxis sp. SCN 67-31]|uniref:hypothetical protein n=1 Tax=Sphingopyxis sp. SCN 67-31 TaxID=1660142 RepID=UPI00086B8064|nr:hypothetical protein [Sphingopyxis sp. SCN 67-31]ODU36618.1 MAG: hypothetical protein ABS88_00055 [Sphingopyxis sp. SCN 67-31]